MNDTLSSAQVVRDISLLYELSLAVGQSLDLETNCAVFLRALLARKNLSFASVWVKDQYLGQADADWATLVYANPKFRIREDRLPLQHPLFSRLGADSVYTVSASDSDFSDFVTEKGKIRAPLSSLPWGIWAC